MQANIRLAVPPTALGVVVLATLAFVGCNNPVSDALSSALKPLTSKYTVGGTASGLNGSGLVLEDNGGDDLALSANGSFTFATALAAGANYAVTVKTQPANPAQACTITNGSGAVATANVTNVAVNCTNNAPAAVTSVGSAVGAPSTAVIDATGGSITSPDARLTVIVPPGAVAAATTFSIQPITNQAPGGVGNAYRLGPAGETFSTTVSISVHYSQARLAGTVADVLSLAYQDAQRRWAVDTSVTLDTTAQTVTVSSPHFSDWALIASIVLEPAAARIGTGETQTLTLNSCDTTTGTDSVIRVLRFCEQLDSDTLGAWSANGIAGGNSAVGTVASTEPGIGLATYTAPAQVPASNPVAVSVSTPVFNPRSGKFGKEIFVANISVNGCSASTARDCTWVGTASASNSHWRATAQVTWQWKENDPADPSYAYYVPVYGSVTLTDLQPNCSVDSTPQGIGGANSVPPSQLTINYHTDPPTVGGTGTNPVGWSEVCAPSGQVVSHPGAVWWLDTGSPVSADGLTIEGSTNVDGVDTSWSFTARSSGSASAREGQRR
jgi:hypothetical protein